ncbi:MAG: DHA2 family efflux MFS transporter permease subunit [Nocardioides sp.]
MSVLLFASFMDLMDATIVNVALPSVQTGLSADASQLEWVVSGYLLAFAALLITGGRLGDIWGRRRVFLVGVVGFTLASLLAGLAGSATELVAFRVAQGAFAGVMVPQVLAIVQALFAPRERAAVYGIAGAVTGLAAVAGPVVGGALVTGDVLGSGWRSVFMINVPIGLLLVLGTVAFIPESRSSRRLRLDVTGVVLVMSGVLALAYPLIEGRQLGWPEWTVGLILASPVLLVVFVLQQRRRTHADQAPLLPTRLFADRGFTAGLVTQLFFQVSVASFFLILTIYLQSGLGFSAWEAGLTILPFSLGAILGSGVAVPLTSKLGRLLVLVGALLQGAGMTWSVAAVAGQGDTLVIGDLILPLGVAGAGLGLLVVPLLDVALATVPVDDSGAASGALSTFQQVGAALGIAAVGVVFFGIVEGAGTMREAFTSAAWVSVSGATIAAAASLALPGIEAVRRRATAEALAAPGGPR